MATTGHSPKLLWVWEMQATSGHGTWRHDLIVDMVVVLGWYLDLVILKVFSSLKNFRILWSFLFCIFYIANTFGFVISSAFKKKSEGELSKVKPCMQTHTWCRCLIWHKWQNLHCETLSPFHTLKSSMCKCISRWTVAETESHVCKIKLLLQTLCVQVGVDTALDICLCKGITCQRPRKPQGSKSLSPEQCRAQKAQIPTLPHSALQTQTLQLVDCGPAEQWCK